MLDKEYLDWYPEEKIIDDEIFFSDDDDETPNKKPWPINYLVKNVIFRKEEGLVVENDDEFPKMERKKLEDCEGVIEKWERMSMISGLALYDIWRKQLYRCKYSTFKEYLRERWDMSRSRAYQIITAATVYHLINAKIKNPAPKHISPLLALSKLYPDNAAMAYDHAYQEYGKVPTAKAIREAIEHLKEKQVWDYLNAKEDELKEKSNAENENTNNEVEGEEKDAENEKDEKEDNNTKEDNQETDNAKKKRKSIFAFRAMKYVTGLEGIITSIHKHKLSTPNSILKDEAIMVRKLLEGLMKGLNYIVDDLS